jgi:hypothetical protein
MWVSSEAFLKILNKKQCEKIQKNVSIHFSFSLNCLFVRRDDFPARGRCHQDRRPLSFPTNVFDRPSSESYLRPQLSLLRNVRTKAIGDQT